MDENPADICGQKIPLPSVLQCVSCGDLNLDWSLFTSLQKAPSPLAGFGTAGLWQQQLGCGRLGAEATLSLWAWGKVGRGQPQNSEVMWGPEQTL